MRRYDAGGRDGKKGGKGMGGGNLVGTWLTNKKAGGRERRRGEGGEGEKRSMKKRCLMKALVIDSGCGFNDVFFLSLIFFVFHSSCFCLLFKNSHSIFQIFETLHFFSLQILFCCFSKQ